MAVFLVTLTSAIALMFPLIYFNGSLLGLFLFLLELICILSVMIVIDDPSGKKLVKPFEADDKNG